MFKTATSGTNSKMQKQTHASLSVILYRLNTDVRLVQGKKSMTFCVQFKKFQCDFLISSINNVSYWPTIELLSFHRRIRVHLFYVDAVHSPLLKYHFAHWLFFCECYNQHLRKICGRAYVGKRI